MWSRWDMQDDPPDVLITNYSMLNIMLMRGVEAPIFDQTRQWLRSDASNIFHFVVDELHTYRGTPGTEVAYLLRVLLDRLGLAPDSDQLRIISSSASVASGTAGLQYLEVFLRQILQQIPDRRGNAAAGAGTSRRHRHRAGGVRCAAATASFRSSSRTRHLPQAIAASSFATGGRRARRAEQVLRRNSCWTRRSGVRDGG